MPGNVSHGDPPTPITPSNVSSFLRKDFNTLKFILGVIAFDFNIQLPKKIANI